MVKSYVFEIMMLSLNKFNIKFLFLICIFFFIFLGINLQVASAGQEEHNFEIYRPSYWYDCDGCGWKRDSSNGYVSNYSLRSGPIECIGTSSICKNVTGPAEITFDWMSDIAPRRGGLFLFLVDGEKMIEYNSYDWKHETYEIRDDKSHNIKFEFQKYRCEQQWVGSGWIDNFRIISKNNSFDNTSEVASHYNTQYYSTKSLILFRRVNRSNNIEINSPYYTNDKNISNFYYIKFFYPKSAPIYVTDIYGIKNYSSIRNAISHNTYNCDIQIEKKYCDEYICIDKPLRLVGLSYPTLCNKNNSYHEVIFIKSSNILISGFKIQAMEKKWAIDSFEDNDMYNNINISNNFINSSNNSICLENVSRVSIMNNTIEDIANLGIYLISCNDSILKDNNITAKKCIYLYDCHNITIIDNELNGEKLIVKKSNITTDINESDINAEDSDIIYV